MNIQYNWSNRDNNIVSSLINAIISNLKVSWPSQTFFIVFLAPVRTIRLLALFDRKNDNNRI